MPNARHSNEGRLRHDAMPVQSPGLAVGGAELFEVRFAAGHRLAPHDHESAYVCLVVSGGYREAYRRRARTGAPGSLVYYSPESPHSGTFGPQGARIFHLGFDATRLRELVPGAAEHRFGDDDRRGGSAAALAWQLWRRLGSAKRVERLELEELTCAVVADAFGTTLPDESTRPTWMARVDEILRQRFREPIGLGEIAAEVDVHPSHLARTVRRLTGQTLGDRLRRLRVTRAASLLSGSRKPVRDVALDCGFADQSHLGRCFKAAFGQTPAGYRRLTRS